MEPRGWLYPVRPGSRCRSTKLYIRPTLLWLSFGSSHWVSWQFCLALWVPGWLWFVILCVWVLSVCVCLSVHHMHSVNRSQKKVSDTLKQELWSCLCFENWTRSFAGALGTLKCQGVSRAPHSAFLLHVCSHVPHLCRSQRTVPFPLLYVWVARLEWPVPYLITALFIQSLRMGAENSAVQ